MMLLASFFVIAAATALPQSDKISIDFRDERSVSSNIEKAIKEMCQTIKDAGLDPLHIEKEELGYELPVPVIFNSAAFVEELLSNGMSNIVVNKVTYSIITSRLNFDIEMPLIDYSLGAASAKATVFNNTFKMQSSGKVEIQKIRFVGQIRFNVGIISGITVRNIKITFTLGGINPDVKLVVQDKDYSNKTNEFLGTTVPDTLKEYGAEINELLEIVLKDIITKQLEK